MVHDLRFGYGVTLVGLTGLIVAVLLFDNWRDGSAPPESNGRKFPATDPSYKPPNRRACCAVPVDCSTYHYRSKRAGQAPLSKRIKEIAESRVRYGYRRIHVLLRREGWPVNVKRVCRLYREQGLQLRNKSPRRRVKAKLRDDRSPATAPIQIWAMDFVHDQLFDGRKIRILTIVDTFTRLAPAIDVRPSYRGIDVAATLDRVTAELGYPKTIRLDNGPEFIQRGARSRGLRSWGHARLQSAWQTDPTMPSLRA